MAAARGYFDVPAGSLSWGEDAMLAGLPQAPPSYNPKHHLALAKLRQHHVLDQLLDNHLLSDARAMAVFREPLPPHRSGGVGADRI